MATFEEFEKKRREAHFNGANNIGHKTYDPDLTSAQNWELNQIYNAAQKAKEEQNQSPIQLPTIDEKGAKGMVWAMVITAFCLIVYGIYSSVSDFFTEQTGGIRLLIIIGWRIVAGIAAGLFVAFLGVKFFGVNPRAGWLVAAVVAIAAIIFLMFSVPADWVLLYFEEFATSIRYLILTGLGILSGLTAAFFAYRLLRLRGKPLLYTTVGSCVLLTAVFFLRYKYLLVNTDF